MKKNDQIRSQRQSLGLDEHNVAKYADLSIHEYDDLEAYDDELYTVVPVNKLLKVCEKLNLNLAMLLDFETSSNRLSLDAIGQRMAELNMSVQELSDSVGITEGFIEDATTDVNSLGTWVVEPIIDLAKALDISPGDILGTIAMARSGSMGSDSIDN